MGLALNYQTQPPSRQNSLPAHAPIVDVLIIGACVSGLIAAREIQSAGRTVWLLDKGRGLDGRLASRRIGAATSDHGAQFITARDARFEAILKQGAEVGMMTQWCQGFSATADGHARWRGKPSMTAFARHLAQGLDTRDGKASRGDQTCRRSLLGRDQHWRF